MRLNVLASVLMLCSLGSLGSSYKLALHSRSVVRPSAQTCPTHAGSASLRSTATADPLSKGATWARQQVTGVWELKRPKAALGSVVSVVSLFLFATPISTWGSELFHRSVMGSLLPFLFVQMYVKGLFRLTAAGTDAPALPQGLSKGVAWMSLGTSLLLGLCTVGELTQPMQAALVGSAVLGTAYSLPSGGLRRTPLFASLCMLVLRGALVNKGFYLQARAAVVGDVLPTIACAYAGSGAGAGAGVGAVAGAGPVGVFCALSKAYPQLSAVTAFFALYGVVISLLKDLPAEGEASYKLPLLEVKVAAPSAFCAAQGAFTGLMAAAAAATLSTIRTAGATQLARIGITGSLLAMAYRARQQAVAVEAGDAQGVSYYNLLWKFFYACYLLLPLFRI